MERQGAAPDTTATEKAYETEESRAGRQRMSRSRDRVVRRCGTIVSVLVYAVAHVDREVRLHDAASNSGPSTHTRQPRVLEACVAVASPTFLILVLGNVAVECWIVELLETPRKEVGQGRCVRSIETRGSLRSLDPSGAA